MKYLIDNKVHKIIYIEYQNSLPHSIVTIDYIEDAVNGPYWCHNNWDCFLEQEDKKDIKIYNSGSGGGSKKIRAPQYIDGFTARYWMDNEFSFEGIPKNIKQLKYPILLEGYYEKSRNPFNVGEIVYSYEYCEKCGFHSEHFCHEHKYDDDEGNVRWKDDDSYAE